MLIRSPAQLGEHSHIVYRDVHMCVDLLLDLVVAGGRPEMDGTGES